jgi:hypothetical protein
MRQIRKLESEAQTMTALDVTHQDGGGREGGKVGPRRKALVSIAIGVSLSLVLGSLLALNSDSVTSEDNKAQSGTFALPAHDLQAARISQSAFSCTGPTFEDGPFTAAVTGTGPNIDLDGGFLVQTADRFCLKNNGTETGRLIVTFADGIDVEVGTCETSEAGTGGDPSCADGAQGELEPLLKAIFSRQATPSTSSSCTTTNLGSQSFTSMDTVPVEIDADLAAGETCAVSLIVQVVGSDAQKFQAQTDRFQWDIVFTLEDIPSP